MEVQPIQKQIVTRILNQVPFCKQLFSVNLSFPLTVFFFFLCVHVHVSVYLSLNLYISDSVSLKVFLSLNISLRVFLSLNIYHSISLSVYPSLNVPLCPLYIYFKLTIPLDEYLLISSFCVSLQVYNFSLYLPPSLSLFLF